MKNIDNHGNVVVLCYQWFEQTNHFKRLKNDIETLFSYSDIEDNPSLESCQKAINAIRDIKPSIIIAIGGGSVIDTAKVIRASLYKDKNRIEELFDSQKSVREIPQLIAVPTTHGTGSEVTMWATVWDKENKLKKSLSEVENYPTIALYDMALVQDLPVELSIITTLDALSHAFESIWNKNRNPISTQYAIQAIKLIYENINKISGDISKEIRRNLMMGSMYAGLAFSNTKTAAAHSISYPLTLRYNIPHGIACSMSLYILLKINSELIQKEIEDLLHILRLRNIEEMWGKIIMYVKSKIPFTLHEYGVKEEDLNWLVEKSFTKGRMDNNLEKLKSHDVCNILNSIF